MGTFKRNCPSLEWTERPRKSSDRGKAAARTFSAWEYPRFHSGVEVTGLGTARNERRATLRIRVVVFLVYPISHLMLALTREWEDIIIQMYCAYLMEVTSAPQTQALRVTHPLGTGMFAATFLFSSRRGFRKVAVGTPANWRSFAPVVLCNLVFLP